MCNQTGAKERPALHYEREYFENLKYEHREQLVKRHFAEVLRWASKNTETCILDGRGRTALDVGCAYGFGVNVLSSMGYTCCGADVSKYSLLIAKQADRNSDFVVSNAQTELPYKRQSFDLVTCFEVLEHLSNPFAAIKSLYGCSRSVLICTTPNRIVDKPVKTVLRDFDQTHINMRTAQEWEIAVREMLPEATIKTETYADLNVKVGKKIVFFRSFRMPYLGLDTRILIKRDG